jgi:hypothetical protein
MRRAARRPSQALVAVVALTTMVLLFVTIDAGFHSASDTLRPWLLGTVVVGAVATAIIVALDRR